MQRLRAFSFVWKKVYVLSLNMYYNCFKISLILSQVSASFSLVINVIDECSPAIVAFLESAMIFLLKATVTSFKVIIVSKAETVPLISEQKSRHVLGILPFSLELSRLERGFQLRGR